LIDDKESSHADAQVLDNLRRSSRISENKPAVYPISDDPIKKREAKE